MSLVAGIIVLLILAVMSCMIYVLDTKMELKNRIFYFVIMVVMLVIVIYLLNVTGFVKLW